MKPLVAYNLGHNFRKCAVQRGVWLLGMDIAEFRERYAKRPPSHRQTGIRLDHEYVKWGDDLGVRLMQPAPVRNVEFGSPATEPGKIGVNTYIWVIDDSGVPYIIERPIDHRPAPKHTNLTGGADAYIGGEVWFSDSSNLFLSGGSGRYRPLGERQLNDAAEVFESYGYIVKSLGWDIESGMAIRYLR